MFESFGLGLLSQSSLLIAGLLACWVKIPSRFVGMLGGFGAGAMLAAVSFDLIGEASHLSQLQLAGWMLIGAAIYVLGDKFVEKRFGSEGTGGSLGIIVGSIVDGVPESLIFGMQIAVGGALSMSFLASVWISNFPQAIAPSADLSAAGWKTRKLGLLWTGVIVACGVASVAGFAISSLNASAAGDRVAALAAGGILTMLTTSLMPFSWERGGYWAGTATVVGFCLSYFGT
jgi:zinc transporter, ZIP family